MNRVTDALGYNVELTETLERKSSSNPLSIALPFPLLPGSKSDERLISLPSRCEMTSQVKEAEDTTK